MFQNLKDMEFGLPKPFTGSKDYKGGGWLGVFERLSELLVQKSSCKLAEAQKEAGWSSNHAFSRATGQLC